MVNRAVELIDGYDNMSERTELFVKSERVEHITTRSGSTRHPRLQGRTRRERTLVASRRQKWTSWIHNSGISDGHVGQDSRGREKRRYKEEKREQYRGL